MFNKFLFALLLMAGIFTMSFTTSTTASPQKAAGGSNWLTVTHPAPRTTTLNWGFSQPAVVYGVIIVDLNSGLTVRSVQTSQTTYTDTTLPGGTYRIEVSNGAEFIICEDSHP